MPRGAFWPGTFPGQGTVRFYFARRLERLRHGAGAQLGQALLLAAGFVVLVAISTTSVLLVDQAREENAWVVHTVEVENQISTLLMRISAAESAARGYLLTGQPRFLAEHDGATANILPDIDKLARLSGDNSTQLESAKELREPVQARLDEFVKIIDFAKGNDIAGGIAMLRQASSSDPARQIREIVNAMRA